MTVGLSVIAIGLGVAIGLFITRSIIRPIARAVEVAETVARGDLTARIEVHGSDEASQLLGALRHMNEQRIDLVGRVRSGSEGIATASAQIAAGNIGSLGGRSVVVLAGGDAARIGLGVQYRRGRPSASG